MSPRIGRTLGSFHHRVDLRLAMHQMRIMAGRWIYPQLEAAMKALALGEVEAYVFCRHNTAAQYIVNLPILDIYLVAE